MSDAKPTEVTIACGCNRTRDSGSVYAEPRYSMMGLFTLTFVGVTAKPKRVDYVCSQCGKTIDSSRDPKVLRDATQ